MDLSVVLLAYGAAGGIEELPAYLQDILGERPLPGRLLKEVEERYRAIGGRSPLLEITLAQAAGLEERLERSGLSVKVRVGMRHSKPRISQAVAQALKDFPRTLVALPMTPYPSKLSVGAYLAAFDAALGSGELPRIERVEGFHREPLLIEAFARKIIEKKRGLPDAGKTALLLTAHSLPERILGEGDSYPAALAETARAVARAAGVSRWRFAYQSKGGGARESWLGPETGDVLKELASEGIEAVLLAPIGFVSDHMETLYDDDVLYRGQALALGLRFERAGALNDSPLFLDALASVVRAKAGLL